MVGDKQFRLEKGNTNSGLSQETGMPDQYDLPPPSKDGVVPRSPTVDGKPGLANGHVPQDEDARYTEKVGWAPRFGQGNITEAEIGESLLDHRTFLESKLDDKFFGGKYEYSKQICFQMLNLLRLVPQHRRYRICLPCLLGGGSSWRWPCLGLHHHGLLWNILSNFNSPGTPEFS